MLQIEDKHRRRVEALRELCKGTGLLEYEDDTDAGQDALRRAFLVEDRYEPKEFMEILDRTFELLPEDDIYVGAANNALGFLSFNYEEGSPPNLTERREAFLKKNGKISARTLMRYEVEGLEILAKCFELAEEQIERRKELEEEEDTSRDLDIQVLRERVAKLEELRSEEREAAETEVAELRGQVAELNGSIAAISRRLDEAIDALTTLSKEHGELLYRYDSTEQILKQQNILLNLTGFKPST